MTENRNNLHLAIALALEAHWDIGDKCEGHTSACKGEAGCLLCKTVEVLTDSKYGHNFLAGTAVLKDAARDFLDRCHTDAVRAGWWRSLDLETDSPDDLITSVRAGENLGRLVVAQKLALIHSEVSEAMEGHRKDLMDDHLPHRPMVEVEMADAVIRIADLAGALGLDLVGAISEKLDYNQTRADHKIENRKAAGGKSY